jgi:hypothetical protein
MMKNLSKYFQIKSMALDENSVSSTIATPYIFVRLLQSQTLTDKLCGASMYVRGMRNWMDNDHFAVKWKEGYSRITIATGSLPVLRISRMHPHVHKHQRKNGPHALLKFAKGNHQWVGSKHVRP